ncbi:hypothetical protein [Nocardia macrotermitis]|uniref:Uncharacterized protein n=1 Tax=Nocardia macrotermitis TaxID=2585198 RepID=A0A7K0DAH4_9NOCA|nr:hypothetical protein [Nocardia macrotermitis]MQY22678.1 hypothetical protein [Nocardia macrotermitis]
MSGQTQRTGKSVIFSDEGTHSGSGEMDEVARSWPQLMSLLTQLMRHLHTATSDGSMKLSRRQWKEMITEARSLHEKFVRENAVSRSWYTARVRDYQREASAVAARARHGATPEQTARDAGYLAGVRAGIEHTVHQTALTSEQRGQVIQSLDAVDADPMNPVSDNIFRELDANAAIGARYVAADSEQRAAKHSERLDATAAPTARPQTATQHTAEADRFAHEATRRIHDLSEQLDALERRIATASQTATAATDVSENSDPQRERQEAHAPTNGQRSGTAGNATRANAEAAQAQVKREAKANAALFVKLYEFGQRAAEEEAQENERQARPTAHATSHAQSNNSGLRVVIVPDAEQAAAPTPQEHRAAAYAEQMRGLIAEDTGHGQHRDRPRAEQTVQIIEPDHSPRHTPAATATATAEQHSVTDHLMNEYAAEMEAEA